MVDIVAMLSQRIHYAAVSVSPFVLMINRFYACFDIRIFVSSTDSSNMIVVYTACQT